MRDMRTLILTLPFVVLAFAASAASPGPVVRELAPTITTCHLQVQDLWRRIDETNTLLTREEKRSESLEAELLAARREVGRLTQQWDLRDPSLSERERALKEKQIEAREMVANRSACASSKACFDYGRCDFMPDYGCVATKDSHCRASTLCTRDGKCVVTPGEGERIGCMAVLNEDCRRSLGCKRDGKCALSKDDAECY